MSSALARNGNGRPADERMAPWTPFRDLLGFDPFQNLRSNLAFEYDVTRTENGYEVEVPVPGYKPEQVDVTLKDGVLSVHATGERRTFSRAFTVPEDVDVDSIEGHVENGMLVLKLNRRPEARPKKISIT